MHREANLNSQELSLLVKMVVKRKRRTHVGGGAMELGKLPVLGRPTIWISVGQGPTALAVDAGVGYLDFFTLSFLSSLLFLPLFGRRPDID